MLLKKNIPLKYIFGKIKYEIAGVGLYTYHHYIVS